MKSTCSRLSIILVGILSLSSLACQAAAQETLVQVTQDFTEDPGWEGIYNRTYSSMI